MKQLIRVKRSGADYSIFLITFAGLPPTTTLSGTSFVTTAPAATTAFLPMVTPQKLRTTADKLLSSGVNHIIWHGSPYKYEVAASVTSFLFLIYSLVLNYLIIQRHRKELF